MRFKLAATASLVASSMLVGRAAAGGDPPENPKIGEGVREEITGSGQAAVVIALVDNEIPCSELFGGIVNEYYFPTYDYIVVPGCAGTITSEAGLDQIAEKSSVVKIDLDGETEYEGSSRKLLTTSVPFVKATDRHRVGNRGAGTTIAVIDTGIDTDHPNFPSGSIVHEACFSSRRECPGGTMSEAGPGSAEDTGSHGTHVAGIVASRGVEGGAGVAPAANIVAIRVLPGTWSDVIAAMDYVANPNSPAAVRDVNIINISIGGIYSPRFGNCDALSSITIDMFHAAEALLNNDILTVAAAGNGGSDTRVQAPACLSNVVAVGNYDTYNSRRDPSSDTNAVVDLFAPGERIESSIPSGQLETYGGTSMASP